MAGRHLESRLLIEELVTRARATGDPTAQARALMILGVSTFEDQPRQSLAAMVECAEQAGRAGMRPVQGLALANASEGAVDLGEWDTADAMLHEFIRLGHDVGVDGDGTTMSQAMLLAHRDDPSAAVALLDDLERDRGYAWVDTVLMQTWWLRSRALCRYLGGDTAGALQDASRSIDLDSSGGNAASSLWVAVQVQCARRDPVGLREVLDATSGLHGQWVQLVRRTASAAVAVLGDADESVDLMLAALRAWTAAGLALDHAYATLCAVHVVPSVDVVRDDIDQARSYLAEAGGASLLRRFDEAT
jgi:hypothetical protein